jgi:hypothetical protein
VAKIWRLEDIDPDNPEERFLPALQSIPVGFGGDAGGRNRMVWPEPIARAISKHLTECGVPPIDPEQATIEYRRPYRGEQNRFNGAGGWVPKGSEPQPDPVVIQDPATMTVREREAVVERMRYMGYRINEPEEQPRKARVVDAIDEPPRFDPTSHTVTEVNAYLRDTDDLERRRVIYAERKNKARPGILKRHKG